MKGIVKAMKVLLIVASGKSSRFGGFPKAFCKIRNAMNVENTVIKALRCFDKIYLAVNEETYSNYKDKVDNCEMFSIVTGQGDAHSLLKCLKYIHSLIPDLKYITVCWGDAVFVSTLPFYQMCEAVKVSMKNEKVLVACSYDEKPYAWFELRGEAIKSSHFEKEEGSISKGWHDQSLFAFDVLFAINYLEKYKEHLGISDEVPDEYREINEMKLLYSFEYLYENEEYLPAKCVEINSGQVLSFNTQDELDRIITLLK